MEDRRVAHVQQASDAIEDIICIAERVTSPNHSGIAEI